MTAQDSKGHRYTAQAGGESQTECTIAARHITGILNPKNHDVSVAFSPYFAVFARVNIFDINIPYCIMQGMRGSMDFGGAGFVLTYTYTSNAGHRTTNTGGITTETPPTTTRREQQTITTVRRPTVKGTCGKAAKQGEANPSRPTRRNN